MNLLNRVQKRLNIFLSIDNYRTFICWLRFRFSRNVRFHIYPNSIVKISRKAVFKIEKGEFAVNASWFPDRKRRYRSELRVDENGTLICQGDFKLFQGASIYVAPQAKLLLKGGGSFLNTNSTLNCFDYIEIGEGVAISDNVAIQDSDNHYINDNETITRPIIIEDHVWIGKNVTILKGVTIGRGAIVGAGAVVTKDIPSKTLAAGNPARIIKENVTWK